MLARLPSPFRLFKSRLSRGIVAWVFASILAIEVIILIPSYHQQEQNLLLQLEQVSSEVMASTVDMLSTGMADAEIIETIAHFLQSKEIILGGALYQGNGQQIGRFGELPEIDLKEMKSDRILRQESRNGARYDVAWLISPGEKGEKYILVIRHDSSGIKPQLYAFTTRTAGLVLLVSAFVAVVAMVVLEVRVITPILRLRDDLIAVDYATDNQQANIELSSPKVTRSDELGEVMAAFNQMCQHIHQEWRDRIGAEAEVRKLNAELEQRVKERTGELAAANVDLKREIIDRQQAQEQLLHAALHDALTGLPNRALFMKKLTEGLNRVREDPSYLFAILFMDCDRFKRVNDSLGHLMGDRLLIAVARRLESSLPLVDTLARLVGDEFAIFLEVRELEEAIAVAEHIHNALTAPFQLEEHEVFINVSIGIVLGTGDYLQPEHLLRDADMAMYRAKELGKGRYQVFDPALHSRAVRRLQLDTDLQLAVERQEFIVYYQPIVSLATGYISGFEALVRWNHPTRGLVSPSEFIPVAEETGSIVPIGEWVFQSACQQLRTWQHQGLTVEGTTMSVNLSVKQFSQPSLIDRIDTIISATELDGNCLKLEITESAIMDNSEAATAILEQLRSRQIQLSIDDFGTGYSSLSYLHRFPVDHLKIDRSFVSRIEVPADENLEILRAIVTLSHNLGMTVIAEGIETAQQLEKLRELGCDYGQGYFFSKPLDSQSAEALLATNPQW